MRIEVLTFLRFVAALVVVVFHFAKKSAVIAPSPGFLTAGPEMVSFFFVLSGYVMILSHWNRTEQPLARFYWARFSRIAPTYFLGLGLTLAVLPAYDQSQLPWHLLFMQAWLPGMPITLNITGWSISAEVFFYAVFPFALSLVRSPRWKPEVLFIASLVAWAMTQAVVIYIANMRVAVPTRDVLHEISSYSPIVHLCGFFLGVTGGAWFLSKHQDRARGSLATSVLAMLSLLVTYAVIEFRSRWQVTSWVFIPTSSSLLAPLFLWTILALSRAQGPVARLFTGKAFVILGDASYAFYILQFPLQRAYVRFVTPGPQPNHGFDMSLGHFCAFVACLLLISIAALYLFERPARRALSRLL